MFEAPFWKNGRNLLVGGMIGLMMWTEIAKSHREVRFWQSFEFLYSHFVWNWGHFLAISIMIGYFWYQHYLSHRRLHAPALITDNGRYPYNPEDTPSKYGPYALFRAGGVPGGWAPADMGTVVTLTMALQDLNQDVFTPTRHMAVELTKLPASLQAIILQEGFLPPYIFPVDVRALAPSDPRTLEAILKALDQSELVSYMRRNNASLMEMSTGIVDAAKTMSRNGGRYDPTHEPPPLQPPPR